MKNPIYVAYYPHESDYCYKIDLPWPKYVKETIVLCKISEGYERARQIAWGVVVRHFNEVTESEEPKERN